MLPETLLFLLNGAIALAQTRQELQLNSIASFSTANLSNLPTFELLPAQHLLTISIALCSGSLQDPLPRFFVTNSTESTDKELTTGTGPNVFEIVLGDGFGHWTGLFFDGGALGVETNAAQVTFEVGVSSNFSDTSSLHEILTALPLLGDTTSNQAIIFSPPFSMPDIIRPTYPNFTLPAGNLSAPTVPANTPNLTLVMSPVSSNNPLLTGPSTGCFLSSQKLFGTIAHENLWLRDEEGWRMQWFLVGLTPATNYTVFVLQDSIKVSGPIFFTTKSAAFACPLVSSLPYCPGIAYAIPLPPPPPEELAYNNTNLPNSVSDTLISQLTNFTTMLTTFPCGRDWYSPLVGCDDCQRAYRKWLCTVTFVRCGEPSAGNPDSVSAAPPNPSATGLSALSPTDGSPQKIFSAIIPQSSSSPSRNPNLQTTNPYSILLPCLETCTAVDRACPNFLGFRCPTMQFNAAASYGVGYIDGADGSQGEGVTQTAQDRWGNVWCNAG